MSPVIVVLGVLAAIMAVTMLFARSPIVSALCLLGILIMTGGIYGLIGEHLVATIQLVVYAGAIMVLFIFSIMLLSLNKSEDDMSHKKGTIIGAIAIGLVIFAGIAYALKSHFATHHQYRMLGHFSAENINAMGGNSRVLAHALFSQFYVSFEVISLALLTAVVGAVVLAKRKFD